MQCRAFIPTNAEHLYAFGECSVEHLFALVFLITTAPVLIWSPDQYSRTWACTFPSVVRLCYCRHRNFRICSLCTKFANIASTAGHDFSYGEHSILVHRMTILAGFSISHFSLPREGHMHRMHMHREYQSRQYGVPLVNNHCFTEDLTWVPKLPPPQPQLASTLI